MRKFGPFVISIASLVLVITLLVQSNHPRPRYVIVLFGQPHACRHLAPIYAVSKPGVDVYRCAKERP